MPTFIGALDLLMGAALVITTMAILLSKRIIKRNQVQVLLWLATLITIVDLVCGLSLLSILRVYAGDPVREPNWFSGVMALGFSLIGLWTMMRAWRNKEMLTEDE